MRFLNGYKTWIGSVGLVFYALFKTFAEDQDCHNAFLRNLNLNSVDLAGGISVALFTLGVIHRWEKAKLL